MSHLRRVSSSDDDSSDSDSQQNQHPQERDLSSEEVEKLVQFQDITGIDDLQICRALLESNNWDLEATAREHLNLPQSSQDKQAPPPLRPLNIHPEAPEVRPVVRANQNGLIRHARSSPAVQNGILVWTFNFLTWPIRWPVSFAFRTFAGIFQFVASILGFGTSNQSRPVQFWPSTTPYDPRADVDNFVADFESRFGRHHPDFFSGSYSQVLERAKQELQFLLVYLHSPSHSDTDRFCRTTLTSAELVDFLHQQNVLLWGCSVETREGYRVSQAMRESSYPFLALVVLRQNRMMIVARFEGVIAPDQLVRKLMEAIRDNEAYIVAARAERQERQINQQIRMEQDAALQESLRQDQEKERKKREEEERKRREEDEERRALEEEERKKETIRKLKIDLANLVPDEPDPNSPENLRIVIKLPNGQRLERRFSKQDSLKSLFYYVFCHPESPDEFDITTNFPRKVIPCRPDNITDHESFTAPTFEEAGLVQCAMLFVNDLDA